MRAPQERLPRIAALAISVSFAALALAPVSTAPAGETIRIWRVGSPYTGETPPPTLPVSFRQDASRRGLRAAVEAFPARGFAALFADAVDRNLAPDVIVFDNFGVMDGTTTEFGRFDGIGREPAIRQHLIKVTDAFDDLLGPQRGWTYLFALSPNHSAARALALTAPRCPAGSSEPALAGELAELLPRVTEAYLEGDDITLQAESDPDRLPATRAKREVIKAGGIRACGLWGNDRFAVAWMNAAYEGESALGHSKVLAVLRKPSTQWQLLVASRDPISNGAFVNDLPRLAAALAANPQIRAMPLPATLLSPANGDFPRPPKGGRLGTSGWQPSPSEDVVAEIAEFAYDDARLFFATPARTGSSAAISAGALWTTRRGWHWRIWSISRAGDVAFSEARTFTH